LDDGVVGDTPENALQALQMVMDNAKEVGLRLNTRKCEVAVLGADSEAERQQVLEQFRTVAPGILEIQAPSATLLGSPLTMPALEEVLRKKTANLDKLKPR